MSKVVVNYDKTTNQTKGLDDINKKLNNTEKEMYKFLCTNEKEKQEFNRIFGSYKNQYDVVTEYKKSRIKRSIGQYTSDYIHNIIKNTDGQKRVNMLKQSLQLMFGEIIEGKDIKNFLDKVGQDESTVENLLKLHKKFSLERFSCLLLIVDDEDVLGYIN